MNHHHCDNGELSQERERERVQIKELTNTNVTKFGGLMQKFDHEDSKLDVGDGWFCNILCTFYFDFWWVFEDNMLSPLLIIR